MQQVSGGMCYTRGCASSRVKFRERKKEYGPERRTAWKALYTAKEFATG